MSNSPRPPAHVEPYVKILGVDGAIAFLLAFGGAELHLPRRDVEGTLLARTVGVELARALRDSADRLPRRVPTAKPWIAAVLRARGETTAAIARGLHTSDKTVRNWLKHDPASGRPLETRQMRLF